MTLPRSGEPFGPGGPQGDRAVEVRLQAALQARAELITPQSLPPREAPAGGSWGTRRVLRTAFTVVAAVVAVLVTGFFLLPDSPLRTDPAPPARHPGVSDSPSTPPPHSPSPPPPLSPSEAPHTPPSASGAPASGTPGQ